MTKENESKTIRLQKLLKTDRMKVLDEYEFLAQNMKDLMQTAGLKQADLASALKMEKTKLIRRFNDPDLWRVKELRVALKIIGKILPQQGD